MQHLIAWLLKRYTPFRVLAWDRGKIAGIGGPNPWLQLDSERIDQVNVQLWAQQKMGEPARRHYSTGEPLEPVEHSNPMKVAQEPKPWPLDRRSRVR